MLTGEPVPAETAASLGIVDAAVLGDLVAAARTRVLEIADSGALPRVRDRSEKLTAGGPRRFEAQAAEAVRRDPDATNVHALARAVRAGLEQDFDAAVAVERAEFRTLVEDPRSKALRYAFFAEREAARVPGLPKDTPRRTLATAAVIGAGTMGGGIAMCFANAGIPVTVIETEAAALERGLDRVKGLYAGSAKRGSITEAQRDERVGRISGAIGLEHAGRPTSSSRRRSRIWASSARSSRSSTPSPSPARSWPPTPPISTSTPSRR